MRGFTRVLCAGSAVAGVGFASALWADDVTSLMQQLRSDPDPQVREEAASDLEDLGIAATSAVPALIEAVRTDRWPDVRQAAANALGDVAEPGGQAVPVLYEAMRDSDGHVRVAARNALFRLDEENKTQVVALEDEFDAAPPVNGASEALYEDVRGLPEALAGLTAIAQIDIYPDNAIVTAKESSSPSGWGRFNYERGVLGGPREGRTSCKKTFGAKDADLTLVPKLAAESLKRAAGDARITLVSLSRGVFCKDLGWTVGIDGGENASMIQFKKNGKVAQVIP